MSLVMIASDSHGGCCSSSGVVIGSVSKSQALQCQQTLSWEVPAAALSKEQPQLGLERTACTDLLNSSEVARLV